MEARHRRGSGPSVRNCRADWRGQARIDIDDARHRPASPRAEAEREQGQRGYAAQQDDLDEMHPRAGQPVHRFRRMMDCVEAPQERPAVEGAVKPILREVGQEHRLDELEQPGLAADRCAERAEPLVEAMMKVEGASARKVMSCTIIELTR